MDAAMLHAGHAASGVARHDSTTYVSACLVPVAAPEMKGRVFIFNLGIYFAKILMYLLNFSLIYEEIIRFC
jgi:hypothetical protein